MTTTPGRWSATALFLVSGLAFGSYLVRLPALKSGHALDDVAYGALNVVFGVTAILAMRLAAPVLRRAGTARVARVAVLAMPLAVVGVGAAPGAPALFAATVLLAAVNGVLDVAMNATAVAVEQAARRPLLSGCHAAWSVGAAVAMLGGTAAIGAGVPTWLHLVVVALVAVPLGTVAGARLPTGLSLERPDADAPPTGAGWSGPIVRIALIATVLMVAEGAALGWGGVLLHEAAGAPLAVAAGATTAYILAQLAGRLVGDRLRAAVGDIRLFRIGAAVAAVGLLVAAIAGTPIVAIAGFVLVGLGDATLVPIAYAETGRRDPTGRAVPRLTTFTYAGVLVGPGAIGLGAAAIGLPATFAAVAPLLALAALVFPRVGRGSPSGARPAERRPVTQDGSTDPMPG